jgi:hypothetical protein
MKSTNAALSLTVVALLSLILCQTALADQPPDNVGGNWTIYSISIENGTTVVKQVQIAQYGNRITGYFEGPDQSGPIQGEVNGHEIRFNTVTRNVLKFSGQIYGNSMNGSYGLHGKQSTWQAVRTSGGGAEVPPATVSYNQNEQAEVVPPAPTPASASSYEYPPQQAPAPAPAPQPSGQPATGSTAQGASSPAPAPLSSDQLDSLVAPIALYPDALVAQVLAAATNPDQVAYAANWLAQNSNLTGTALAQAVDQQSWDPSVKAMTQFPSVLDNMAHNLSWTSSLGQAFANQQSDVMAAVQAMRSKAQAAGSLQSNSQITVTAPAANTIVIQPANPQVVYVPQYNPTVVYGAPVVVPYYVPPPVPVAVGVGVYFGSGITVGAAFGGGGWAGGFGWGWHAWGLNWGCCGGGGSTTIIYNHNTYINNHTWNNTNYNGYRPWANGAAGSQNHAWYGNNGTFHPDGNYKPGEDTHYGPNGAYHPNGYYGPDGGFHPDVPGTGPAHMPNGGDNGNHGLIGGNGGTQNPNAGTTQYAPGARPNGGDNGNHGLIGGNGGVQHAPGYVPTQDQPNGGRNGDHGLIGGNGGTDHGPDGGRNGDGGLIGGSGAVRNQEARNADRSNPGDLNRSRMSGDGAANRMESNRGRTSMAGRRPQPRMARQHAPVQHRPSGGGGRRR